MKLNFQLIIESIPALVAVLTPTGEVEALNQPVLDYFGKSFEELTGWANLDVVHPDDLAHMIESLRKALARGESYELESRHRRADGVYRWFHTRGFPLKDTDGRILRWCFLLADIDGRKRAEAQLAGEKRLLEMVASSCPLTDVLTALCKFVEDTSSDCYCGVYLIDWSGSKFRVGAAPSLPATFNDPVEGLTVSPQVGPCGVAALKKTQVIATDLESDPLWQSSAIRPPRTRPRNSVALVHANLRSRGAGVGNLCDFSPRTSEPDANSAGSHRAGYPHCQHRHRAGSERSGAEAK